MYKNKIILSIIAIILGAGLIIKCGNTKIKNVVAKKEIKIGVSVYKKDDTFISTMSKNIEKISREKALVNDYKINISVVDANGNQLNQNEQVDRFILQEYDVICVNMVDRTAAAVIIDKAKLANIPIIFFNREPVEEDMQRWNKVYYIGAKTEESGEMQAKIVIDKYKENKSSVDKNGDGKIQYVMLEGEQGHQDALIRTEYCIKTIIENGIAVEKLANDTANWQRAQGSEKMTKWIKDFGDKIEVVFSNNDDMALGAIDAFNLQNSSKIPLIVGVDATPQALQAVKEGELIGTVFNDSIGQASAIFDIAYRLAIKGDVNELYDLKNERYLKIGHSIITSENVELYLDK